MTGIATAVAVVGAAIEPGNAEPKPVHGLVRNAPLHLTHPPLRGIGQDAVVAIEVGLEVGGKIRRGGIETRRRTFRTGIDVLDLDTRIAMRSRAIPFRVLPDPALVELWPGTLQVQPLDDVASHIVARVRARRRLDDQPEQRVADNRALAMLVRLQHLP